MTLSIEDAILRLKAEIIAQDWRLSPKRAEQLDASLLALRGHFKSKKAIHAMLVMAANVLGYIKSHGATPPETIDFLKEAMAHIVSLYEDLVDDPAKEDEIFQGLFVRFTTLKGKIKIKAAGKVADTALPPAERPTAPPSPGHDQDDTSPADETLPINELIMEFKSALANTSKSGQALNQLFDKWLESPAVASLLRGDPAVTPAPGSDPPRPPEHITACPPTKVRIVTISGLQVAIQSSVIAMIRSVSPAKAAAYLQGATVPLKDFSRFFLKLRSLFSGSLALVKEGTLKELSLPVMIPQGDELPPTPPTEFGTLVIISNGNWHGALACNDIEDSDQIMVKFAKQHNGDLAGIAYLEAGGQVTLLDPLSMLRREGILLMR